MTKNRGKKDTNYLKQKEVVENVEKLLKRRIVSVRLFMTGRYISSLTFIYDLTRQNLFKKLLVFLWYIRLVVFFVFLPHFLTKTFY